MTDNIDNKRNDVGRKSRDENGYLLSRNKSEYSSSEWTTQGETEKLYLTGHGARRKHPGIDKIIWDSKMPGFGLRYRKTGSKSWILFYRERQYQRLVTLGKPPVMSVHQARKKARHYRCDAALTGLPEISRKKQSDLTISNFIAEYLVSVKGQWKTSTYKRNVHALQHDIMPFFGAMALAKIGRKDVNQWRDSYASQPSRFNRAVPVLSSLFKQAEILGHRPLNSNPCKGIARYKQSLKERFLSAREYRVLGRILREVEGDMPDAVAIIRLLIYTGARKNEIAVLRREWIKSPRIFLPDSKTGAKQLYINVPAHTVLQPYMARRDKGLLFPSTRNPNRPFEPSAAWYKIRSKAGLNDVRLHDLRHSFASVAIGNDIPLTHIGALLGHALPETTARYAHLADEIITESAARISGSIAKQMGMMP